MIGEHGYVISYLIEEEKVAVIDTVWAPFAKEYVANLENQIDLSRGERSQ